MPYIIQFICHLGTFGKPRGEADAGAPFSPAGLLLLIRSGVRGDKGRGTNQIPEYKLGRLTPPPDLPRGRQRANL